MAIHNKLVRDNIPSLLMQKGIIGRFKQLNLGEGILELRKKLNEEVKKYGNSYSVDDLVDIVEVCIALASKDGINEDELMNMVHTNRKERGAFNDNIYLISTED